MIKSIVRKSANLHLQHGLVGYYRRRALNDAQNRAASSAGILTGYGPGAYPRGTWPESSNACGIAIRPRLGDWAERKWTLHFAFL